MPKMSGTTPGARGRRGFLFPEPGRGRGKLAIKREQERRKRMYDFVIIGGGIVGISTAYHLVCSAPGAKVPVLETEPCLGLHQTRRSRGGLRSAIHYRPWGCKARL